ncbi:hypothetical protein ES705_38242 [subsurface metagenome]
MHREINNILVAGIGGVGGYFGGRIAGSLADARLKELVQQLIQEIIALAQAKGYNCVFL